MLFAGALVPRLSLSCVAVGAVMSALAMVEAGRLVPECR